MLADIHVGHQVWDFWYSGYTEGLPEQLETAAQSAIWAPKAEAVGNVIESTQAEII